jgi:hypothetical protein
VPLCELILVPAEGRAAADLPSSSHGSGSKGSSR